MASGNENDTLDHPSHSIPDLDTMEICCGSDGMLDCVTWIESYDFDLGLCESMVNESRSGIANVSGI